MTDFNPQNQFCSTSSVAYNEPLAGTAKHVANWLLLEYPLAWAAKIERDNQLPAAVNEWLHQQKKEIDNFRVQYIRQKARRKAPWQIYFVTGDAQKPRMYNFQLKSYENLLDVDLSGCINDIDSMRRFTTDEPIFLVCVNGKRDRCCAKFGLPVFKEMAKIAPKNVWQCSHIGGDRFAPNVLCFPGGICYGRIRKGEGQSLIESYVQNRVLLDRLRGRTFYPKPVQAAEIFALQELGEINFGALRWTGITASSDAGETEVEFFDMLREQQHKLRMRYETHREIRFHKNCSAEEASPLTGYRLLELRSTPSK